MRNVAGLPADVKARLLYGYHRLADGLVNPQSYRRVSRTATFQKIGPLATDIWLLMLGLRRADGVAYPSIDLICKGVDRPRRSVQRALALLGKSGLVAPIGYRYVERYDRQVYHWEVAGEVSGRDLMLVPRATYRWIRGAKTGKTWGGARKGAGRPKVERSMPKTKRPFKLKTTSNSSGAQERKVVSPSGILQETPTESPASPSEKPKRGRATFSISEKGGRMGGEGKTDPGGWWPHLVREGHVPRPPLYHARRLPLVNVPLPYKLKPSMSDEAIASFLAQAFRDTHSLRRIKTNYFRNGAHDIKNSKFYDGLVRWGRFMLSLEPEKHIAPTIWLMFRLDGWKANGKAGPMNPEYAFHLDHLRKPQNRGWCRREMGVDSMRANRVVVSKPLAELRRRYDAMRVAVFRLGAWAPHAKVHAVVDHFFPDDLYDLLWQEALIAQQRLQESINTRVAKGDPKLWR